jgi:nucleotide-binding universal stress UspA family protein
MQTVIVPIDFSETSFNAAQYAYNMFKNRQGTTLILYHFYNPISDLETERNYLENLKNEFSSASITVETLLESGDNFIDSLAAFAHVRSAYMIVMGLIGKTAMEQRFSGGNTLKMAEKSICPVLIVPSQAVYKSTSNVLITSEMKYVQETPVLLAVKKILADFNPSLHILNVDSEHYISITEEVKAERDKMEALLSEFNPEFYFMRLYDFHEAVNLFTADKDIDMIIIEPKYHSFFDNLFKTQHAKPLIYHSKVPVLAIHE